MTRPLPFGLTVDIVLDDNPRYRGSIHDDAVARAAGYRAALIPGAFVYGHVSRIGLEAWGPRWLETGGMSTRFLRPVFNGDRLTLDAAAPIEDGAGVRSDVAVLNAEGATVATGWVSLPHEPPPPPAAADLPLTLMGEAPVAVAADDLAPGRATATRPRVVTAEDLAQSRRAFDERHPIYGEDGIAHPGFLMRHAMGETNGGFRFPAPVVLVEAQAQHFARLRAGAHVAVSGRIVETYERKGRRYFVSEEYLVADRTTVAARIRRTTIYA